MQGDNAGGYGGVQGDTGAPAGDAPAQTPRERMMTALRLAVEAQELTRKSGYDRTQREYEHMLWQVVLARVQDYKTALDRVPDAC